MDGLSANSKQTQTSSAPRLRARMMSDCKHLNISVDTDLILTSCPPQYKYICEDCGYISSFPCSELEHWKKTLNVLDGRRYGNGRSD
jgi:hypothetical protein